jgi:hypothetical protein
MEKALAGVVFGLVAFVLTQELVGVLITGTDTGSVLLQQLLPLAIAIGVVIGGLLAMLKSADSGKGEE